ncbi:hypothetical protein CKO28_13320 [Rhodovibrio sodomensis]|uniref:Yip1 domain-containing protein n=1 Tax=Rhodovibrio sodomensis TaxID=1088 RepID=A0ABS1DEW5_9PROT|nr:hypothetical protein [Rhodovibrio sodomensis]MBK1669012.1 hypothetical protein [Rhodovibrio sodomensis]
MYGDTLKKGSDGEPKAESGDVQTVDPVQPSEGASEGQRPSIEPNTGWSYGAPSFDAVFGAGQREKPEGSGQAATDGNSSKTSNDGGETSTSDVERAMKENFQKAQDELQKSQQYRELENQFFEATEQVRETQAEAGPGFWEGAHSVIVYGALAFVLAWALWEFLKTLGDSSRMGPQIMTVLAILGIGIPVVMVLDWAVSGLFGV